MSLTSIAVLLAFLGMMGLALLRHPIYGLYAYIAVFYLDPPSRWWGAALPDLRWSLFAAVVTLIASMRLPTDKTRAPWYSATPPKLLIAFAVWLWMQYFWALVPERQLELALLFTKYVLLYYLIYRLVDSRERAIMFLLVHIAGCFYFGWLGFTAQDGGRLEGVGGPGVNEANALAMHVGTGVLAGAMLILALRGYRQWFVLLAMPFMLNILVLAGSRGAFLGLLVGGLALFFLKPRSHRGLFYAFAAAGVVLFLSVTNQSFWERMGTIGAAVDRTEQMDESAASRYAIVAAQWRMFQNHPLGAGHRGTAALSRQYLEVKYLTSTTGDLETNGERSSHNTIMTVVTEHGIPGIVLLVALVLSVARAVLKLRDERRPGLTTDIVAMNAAVGGMLALVFVAGNFTDYIKTEVVIWALALLGCLGQLPRQPVRALASEAARPDGRSAGAHSKSPLQSP
jgi:O-antigen ligase